VVEGRVRVDPTQSDRARNAVLLTSGQVATTNGASMLVVEKSARRLADELSWRRGALVFDHTTLAEAAAEFNRYGHKELVISDDAADVAIGGSFQAANVEAFVQLLNQAFGLHAKEYEDKIQISR